MKLSVSVPDDLWSAAREIRPDLNPSHLVQQALEAWTSMRAAPAFSRDRPPDADAAFVSVRDSVAAIARTEFERGYRAALSAAHVLEFGHLQSLSRGRFDLATWARGIADAAVEADLGHIPKHWGPKPATIGALVETLGNLVPPFGDNEFGPSAPYLRGFAQAMRDLWEAAVEGAPSASEGSDDEH
jgi:hypothetical protein